MSGPRIIGHPSVSKLLGQALANRGQAEPRKRHPARLAIPLRLQRSARSGIGDEHFAIPTDKSGIDLSINCDGCSRCQRCAVWPQQPSSRAMKSVDVEVRDRSAILGRHQSLCLLSDLRIEGQIGGFDTNAVALASSTRARSCGG